MKSWTTRLPALTLAFGVTALSAATYVFTRGFDPTGGYVSDAGPSVTTAPLVRERVIGQEADPRPRPDGLRELSVVSPADVRLTDQRRGLVKHLAGVKLTLNVPDAMSYHGRREGKLMVLSGASGPGTGFFLFSERGAGRLTANPRKFLREYFKDTFDLRADAADVKFLSRFAGELTWIRGEAANGPRFDAYVLPARKGGFAHLLFIADPTVANATRRMMVDSIKPAR